MSVEPLELKKVWEKYGELLEQFQDIVIDLHVERAITGMVVANLLATSTVKGDVLAYVEDSFSKGRPEFTERLKKRVASIEREARKF